MSDKNYSTIIYNRVQTERVYEDSDPEENGGPLYDEVHEDVKRGDNLYVNELENHEYDSVAVYTVGRQGRTLASLQPETGEYVLPDETCSKAQDPHPGEPTEDEDISLEELFSPTKDQESDPEEPQGSDPEEPQGSDPEEPQGSDPEEPQGSDPEEPQGSDPEEPQENGSEMEADLPSPSSFTIQNSRAFSTREISPTSYSADDVSEGNESASTSPEINLFVKMVFHIKSINVTSSPFLSRNNNVFAKGSYKIKSTSAPMSFLPGKSQGQKSQVDSSPRGHEESNRTEYLSAAQYSLGAVFKFHSWPTKCGSCSLSYIPPALPPSLSPSLPPAFLPTFTTHCMPDIGYKR
ncbi:hypothetical protein FD755_022404 [Muntiacus reevesi]|uniref:Uncharacterized protein n=1 Tax=Muntiacus reevesi TaxID=9886 RepID=A0A5N3W1E9_MUNRE|nr:hypothetical protein FD755_022404 [Muntiacus reevesi]